MAELHALHTPVARHVGSLMHEIRSRLVTKRQPGRFVSETAPSHLYSRSRETDDPWRENCERILQANDLTPREKEVFVLLARGRNAQRISDRLNISNHTTKCHIYNIYRKLEVKSHQELIDLAEFGKPS